MKSSLMYMGMSIALASATLAPQPALWRHPNHNVVRQFQNTSTPASTTSTSQLPTSIPSTLPFTPITYTAPNTSTTAPSTLPFTPITYTAPNTTLPFTPITYTAPNTSATASSTLPFTPITFSASNTSTSLAPPSTSGVSSVPSTTSSTNPTVTVSPSPQIEIFVIIIIINIDITLAKDKRDAVNVANTAEYIAPNGTSTTSCDSAAQWYIQDGQLFSLAGGQLGTSPGVDSEFFVASEDPGSITTTFTRAGNLAWSNGNFTDGSAVFRRLTDEYGTISILFDGAPPPGLIGSDAVTLGITTCPGGSNTVNNTIINNNINNNINNDNSVTNNNVINNYNSYNVYEILPSSIINSFNTGAINYYSGDDTFYYAKMCPVCPIVQAYKANDTYAEPVCATCPAEVMHCPGVSHQSSTSAASQIGSNHPANAGVCDYEAPVCVSCENKQVVAPPSMTTVTVPCPTCPSSVTTLSCPASVVSSVQSVASAQGPAAAQSAASAANAPTVTASGQSAAPSTVVNVACTSCPASSQAKVVAQVAATSNAAPAASQAAAGETGSSSPASPKAPSGGSASSNKGSSPGSSGSGSQASNEGGSSPAASSSPESFTGSANALQISKLVAMFGLLLPVAMF